MTVDKFGRHITHKRANKIYLIEDTQQELQQQWTEEFEKFKNVVSTQMNGLPPTITSKLSQDVRCAVFQPFSQQPASSNSEYYTSAFNNFPGIEILIDSKIVYAAYTWNVDVRITYPDDTESIMKFAEINGEVTPKGSKIFFVRYASYDLPVLGSFVYEIAPWHKDESPF